MKGIAEIVPDGKKGEAEVSHFEYKASDNKLFHMRSMINDPGGVISDGNYARLHVNGELVMSDTNMEKRTNSNFVRNANGKILIGGLGLGLILHNLRDKLDVIESIEVIEKSQDVIDLVSPNFKDLPLTCIQADMMDWTPPKGSSWDTIYFDIWPDRNTENLTEIKVLHNRFKFKLNRDNPNCWMDSWYKNELQAIVRRDKAEGYYF